MNLSAFNFTFIVESPTQREQTVLCIHTLNKQMHWREKTLENYRLYYFGKGTWDLNDLSSMQSQSPPFSPPVLSWCPVTLTHDTDTHLHTVTMSPSPVTLTHDTDTRHTPAYSCDGTMRSCSTGPSVCCWTRVPRPHSCRWHRWSWPCRGTTGGLAPAPPASDSGPGRRSCNKVRAKVTSCLGRKLQVKSCLWHGSFTENAHLKLFMNRVIALMQTHVKLPKNWLIAIVRTHLKLSMNWLIALVQTHLKLPKNWLRAPFSRPQPKWKARRQLDLTHPTVAPVFLQYVHLWQTHQFELIHHKLTSSRLTVHTYLKRSLCNVWRNETFDRH